MVAQDFGVVFDSCQSMGLAFSEAYDILPQQLRFERLWVETGGKSDRLNLETLFSRK
jgi:hypothetical protein